MKRGGRSQRPRVGPRQAIAQAKSMRSSGDVAGALKLLRSHRGRGADAELLMELGKTAIIATQRGVDTRNEQVTSLEAAARLRPEDPVIRLWLGRARFISFDFANAASDLAEALHLSPGNQEILGALGQALIFAGEHEQAYDTLSSHAGALRDPLGRWALGECAWRCGHEQVSIDALQALGEDADVPAPTRSMAWFSLAKMHDRLGRYDDAFAAATSAHALEQGKFDPDIFDAAIDRHIELFSSERMQELPTSGSTLDRALFILGMPRSGTTLMERMLDRHPRITGVGELPTISAAVRALDAGRLVPYTESDPVLSSLDGITAQSLYQQAKAYKDRISGIGSDVRYAADKLPMNFLHLGVIALLLPRCRVIHMVRDPRDTCLSYHTTFIGGPHARRSTLPKLARFYNGYARLMAHWKSVLSLNMLEVRYRDIAHAPDATMRSVLDFLELPYDDATTRPHEGPRVTATASFDQVSKPIHTKSAGRWRNYEMHLRPLLDLLDPAALAQADREA
ncbi:MAG: sulfotransferase [Planctomycetota bacterium]